MVPVILYRGEADKDEWYAITKHFPFQTKRYRTDCKNNLVVGRYSVLPFYKELEEELVYSGSKLINSYRQHKWIADFQYYEQLKDYTFETWNIEELPYIKYNGPFILKGRTNSRKFDWNRLMYAKDKQEAALVGSELYRDSLIGQQGIIVRKYEKLKTLEIAANNLPFTNEWRFFFLGNTLISYGYYWSVLYNEKAIPPIEQKCIDLAKEIANIAKDYANFFVLDIAQKETEEWVLVEVNDGQMSGLCMIDYYDFYGNLKKELDKNWTD